MDESSSYILTLSSTILSGYDYKQYQWLTTMRSGLFDNAAHQWATIRRNLYRGSRPGEGSRSLAPFLSRDGQRREPGHNEGKGPMDDQAVTEVFAFWRDLLSPRARLDERRRRLIRARLEDGYSAEELKLACLGCRASSFHQGDNDRGQRYCSIDLICRNAEKVEQFL